MALGRIRKGKVITPTGITGAVNLSFKDNDTYDRTAADDQLAGDPVKVGEGGSGSIELLAGADIVLYDETLAITYVETVVASGTETDTTKTMTFSKVTTNNGASVPNDQQRGSKSIDFEYGGRVAT